MKKRVNINDIQNPEVLAHASQPLVLSITNQFYNKNARAISFEEIKGAADEGLARAIVQYDSKKSDQSFSKYAGWCIRNSILNYLSNESHIVRTTSYAYKKAKTAGTLEVSCSISIDQIIRDKDEDSCSTNAETRLGLAVQAKDECLSPLEYLCLRLEHAHGITESDRDAFYSIYGLNGYPEDIKLTEYARAHSLSNGRVSQKVKKVLDYIRGDKNLKESLAQLMD